MIENLLQTLAESRFAKASVALINRIPFPYSRLPVGVHNQRMYAHNFDRYLALWAWKLGLMGASEFDLLAQSCKAGMFAVDIGANIGFYSLLLSRQVGAEGHVWALEPDLDNFATLQRNLRANRCTNVSTINSAVSSTSGEGYLYLSSSHSGDHRIYHSNSGRAAIPIRTIALDDFFPPEQRIDLVKMDVQGAEGMALQGMMRIIESNPGLVIFMEFWPAGLLQAGSVPEEVIAGLQSRGFTLEQVDGKTGALHCVDTPQAIVQSLPGSRYTHLLAKRDLHDPKRIS